MLKLAMGMLFGSMLVLLLTELPHFMLSASILLLAVYFLIFFNKPHRYNLTVMIAITAGFFMTASVANYQQVNGFKSTFEGRDLIVHGQIASLIKINDYSRSFLFDVDSAKVIGSDESLDWSGLIRLSIYSKRVSVKAGQRWQFQVRLKRSAGFINPGGFDYEKWLFAQRIEAAGYVRKSEQHTLLAEAPWYSINALRETIHQKIKASVGSADNRSLISALMLAEKSDVSKEQWSVLRATGTSHLMAISGLHIGLVASSGLLLIWMLWWCFPTLNLYLPSRVASTVLGVLLAVSYAMLAGMTIPTQRALIMVVAGLLLLVGKQYFSNYRILTLALILVLIVDPLAVMNVGFYLSFSAVFVILWLLHRVMKMNRFNLLKLQCYLSLLMIPLSLLFFSEGSLVSPIANIIAIPWVSFVVVPLSMLSVLLSFISDSLATYLFQFLSLHLDALFTTLAFLAKAPAATFEAFHLPGLLLVSLVVAAMILLLPIGISWRYSACLALLPLVFFQIKKPGQQGEFWLTILDVGQGLSVVVETQNHSLVYDTGYRASESFDLGEMVVVPYLKSQAITQLDAVVISHDDRDHMGGLEAVLAGVKVKSVYSNRMDLLEYQSNRLCKRGDFWEWDGVRFEFIHPTAKWPGSDNNRSCVMKITTGEHQVLLTGDIQRRAERHLLKLHQNSPQTNPLLSADIVLMPHHGSNSSSQKRFIMAVNPTWAIASAGYRSRYKHPDPRVIERYKDQEVTTLSTANSGAIQFRIKRDQPINSPVKYRALNKGFWSRQD